MKETIQKGVIHYMNKIYSGYFDVIVRGMINYNEFFSNESESYNYEINIFLDKKELLSQPIEWSDIKSWISNLLKMMGIRYFEVRLSFIK